MSSSPHSEGGSPSRQSSLVGEVVDNVPPREEESTPLPKFQLFVVCCIQLAEPVTSSVIYPFVNQLVRETGVTKGDERKTGYYAGLIESVFFAAEAITVLQWGHWSDRIGRKPILLGGMLGLAASMVSFGLSKQFWGLVVSRCAQGAFNGNIGVTKSVIAEITDASNLAQAFAYIPFVWCIGVTAGPIMGGILAKPADRWPETFGSISFFRTYPYFLPCSVAGSVAVLCFLLTLAGLKETLPSAAHEKQSGVNFGACDTILNTGADLTIPATMTTNLIDSHNVCTPSYGTIDQGHSSRSTLISGSGSSSPTRSKHPPGFRDLLIPRIITLNINYAILSFSDQCFQVLIPLMYSTSIPLGGLGFSPYTIGLIMSILGLFNGPIQILAFARVRKLVGHRNLYVLGMASYLVSLAAFPVMSVLAKREGRVDGWVWAVLVIQLGVIPLCYMSFGCMFIYLSHAAPSRDALGSTNGLAQMTASTMRTLAPSVASSLFSLSLEWQLAGGTAVYWILCVVVLAGLYACRSLPKHSN